MATVFNLGGSLWALKQYPLPLIPYPKAGVLKITCIIMSRIHVSQAQTRFGLNIHRKKNKKNDTIANNIKPILNKQLIVRRHRLNDD